MIEIEPVPLHFGVSCCFTLSLWDVVKHRESQSAFLLKFAFQNQKPLTVIVEGTMGDRVLRSSAKQYAMTGMSTVKGTAWVPRGVPLFSFAFRPDGATEALDSFSLALA